MADQSKKYKFDISNLNLHYGDFHALKDVNMQIEANKITAFIGPSGCGKSTFLKTLNRMNDLVENCKIDGKVLLDGTDIYKDMDEITLRYRVGMVFQQPNPFPKSVYDNVAYGPRIAGIKKKSQLDEIVERSLRQAAIWDELKDRLHKSALGLSGGQQQRVALARALVIEPSVLLFDEPLSNLDAKLRVQMRTVIKKLQRRLGITTIYVTHDQEEALAISDRIAVMKEGNIMQVGTPEEIYKKPENTFVAGFIGVSNFVECDVKGDDPGKAVLDVKGECSIICTLKKPFNGKGIISARPEQLFFDDKEGLPGTITISTFLGDFIEYEILLDNGQTVQLNEYTKDVHELRPDGEKVKVNFDIRAVGVYDAATQEVISW